MEWLLMSVAASARGSAPALRVLCMDIEGARGGSSRSLYHLLRWLDRTNCEVEVWCRNSGMIEEWYAAEGIGCTVKPELPRFTAPRPGFRETVHQIRVALPPFLKSLKFVRSWAAEIEERFDIVHFNHPAFFMLSYLLRQYTRKPFVMHIRTRPDNTMIARWQARLISKVVDRLIFITENERCHFQDLGGTSGGDVIYNVPGVLEDPTPSDLVPKDERLKVASLSNYVWVRGVDRIVEVAAVLANRGRRDILFVMAGNMKLHTSSPGMLGEIGNSGGSLSDYVDQKGLSDMFLFTGHVTDPERLALACDVMIKLTREYNPWGRDTIECLYLGRPAISIGSWDTFIVHEETG
ncbi:MAG TPA: glycosyltransferase, partial [Sneathiellales bacterium]|nr:glycosyltransferase [Sneathiellales bacterium]